MNSPWPGVKFHEFLQPKPRPYTLGPDEDANLVGMRWYGEGPFHRELKLALRIAKKSHFVIQTGDVIYNKLFAWKGAFGIVPAELDGMFVSDKFPTYELDRNRCDENFLRWYFRCPPLWEEARTLSTGSAAVSKFTLNPPRFLDLTISLPPLAEQRQIVAQIETLAAKTEEATSLHWKATAETDVLVHARLHQICAAIHGEGTLADVLVSAPRNGWSATCDHTSEGTPVLSLGAVTGYRYRPTQFKRTTLPASKGGHFWLKPGDMLMTRSNTPELVGHVAIYNGHPSPCIYPDLMMRLELRAEMVEKAFVWYWLQAPQTRDFINKHAKGTSPTMKKISQGTVMAIPFPTSLPLSEQRRIVAELDALQVKVDVLKHAQAETAAELDALLPSILDRAFKGEL